MEGKAVVLLYSVGWVLFPRPRSRTWAYPDDDDNDMRLVTIFKDNPVSRYQNVSILDFIGAKGDGGGGDNWSYETFRAPVKSSPPTNQHLTFYGPDAFLSLTNSVRALKGKGITFHRLAHPKLTTGYSNLDFDH